MPRKSTKEPIKMIDLPVNQARKEGKPMAAKENNFTKVIIKDEQGNKYTLEFNARVVKRMQRNGFKVDSDYPNVMIEELLTGAFQMHHKGMMPEKIMEVWQAQSRKDELLGILIKLYMRPLEDLMAEPDEETENADPTWETV